MPSLILTGWPSSGKTTFANLLSERALKHKSNLITSTIIVNEERVRPDKTKEECYANSREEKLTRSALKAEFERYQNHNQNQTLNQNRNRNQNQNQTLVILDSTNYIKGYRYELHCISKSAGERHGVIWIITPEQVVAKWNSARQISCQMSTETVSGLMARYEPPDQRNRWDKPLYRVDVALTLDEHEFVINNEEEVEEEELDSHQQQQQRQQNNNNKSAKATLNKSVYNMHSLNDAIDDSCQITPLTSKSRLINSTKDRRLESDDNDNNHNEDNSLLQNNHDLTILNDVNTIHSSNFSTSHDPMIGLDVGGNNNNNNKNHANNSHLNPLSHIPTAKQIASKSKPSPSSHAHLTSSSPSPSATSSKSTMTSFRKTNRGGFRRATKKNNNNNVIPKNTYNSNINKSLIHPNNDNNPTTTTTTTTSSSSINTQNIIQQSNSNSNSNKILQDNTNNPNKKMEDYIDEILDSFLLNVQPLKEGLSTKLQKPKSANMMHEIDTITQLVANAFLHAQKQRSAIGGGSGMSGGPGTVGKLVLSVPNIHPNMEFHLNRSVQPVEIRRLRRQYTDWVSNHPPIDISSHGIATSFLQYLENLL